MLNPLSQARTVVFLSCNYGEAGSRDRQWLALAKNPEAFEFKIQQSSRNVGARLRLRATVLLNRRVLNQSEAPEESVRADQQGRLLVDRMETQRWVSKHACGRTRSFHICSTIRSQANSPIPNSSMCRKAREMVKKNQLKQKFGNRRQGRDFLKN